MTASLECRRGTYVGFACSPRRSFARLCSSDSGEPHRGCEDTQKKMLQNCLFWKEWQSWQTRYLKLNVLFFPLRLNNSFPLCVYFKICNQ